MRQHIDKEQLNTYPLAQFGGYVKVVSKLEHMAEAMEYLCAQSVVGVDTETRPSFVKGVHYPTALVQIATLERCYLFQINRMGMPEELTDFFANPSIRKVGLAFKDDLNGLRRLRPFTPQNCIDIQQMVNDYGIFDMGLQKIYAIVFEEKISKSQQLTNWDTVALTAEQARYASTDAWATLRIYLALKRMQRLPKKEVMRLRQEEKEKMIQHQQEVLEQRKNNDDNISKKE